MATTSFAQRQVRGTWGMMGGIFCGTKYLFLFHLWGYQDSKLSLEKIMPQKDILRSEFAWHINQCSNSENYEILFWEIRYRFLFPFPLSIWLFFFVSQNIHAPITKWSLKKQNCSSFKTWNFQGDEIIHSSCPQPGRGLTCSAQLW